MSVLAVKNYKDKIVIGADTQVTRRMTMDKITKLFVDENKNLYYGMAGSCDEVTAFQVFLKTNIPAGSTIKDLHEFFTKFAKFKKNFTGNWKLDNYYLIVFENIPYFVDNGLYIKEIKTGDYKAIGSGYVETETVLYLGKIVKESLEVACEKNIYCNTPIDIYTIKKE